MKRSVLIITILYMACTRGNIKDENLSQISFSSTENYPITFRETQNNEYEKEGENKEKTTIQLVREKLSDIQKNENLSILIDIEYLNIYQDSYKKEIMKLNPFPERFIDRLITFVDKYPIYTKLKLKYSIHCNSMTNSKIQNSYETTSKIFYLPQGPEFIKMTTLILSEFRFILLVSYCMLPPFLVTDGFWATEKSLDDALNQFKEDFKMNLEKTAQACKVKGKL